jgi:hypothetical protein
VIQPLFNNETADKCGRLFDGATTANGLTPNAVACSSQKSLTKDRGSGSKEPVRKNQPQFRK